MNTWKKLGELMVAVSFAEAGGHKCARGVLKSIRKAELESKSARELLKRERYSKKVDHIPDLLRRPAHALRS